MSETFFMLLKLPLVAGQPSSIQSRDFKAWASDLGISSFKCPQHLELDLPRYLQIDFMPFEERTIQGYENDRT